MKSTSICHPPAQPLALMRAWQVVACGGNCCAALLLNHFEYWHNVKLEQADQARKINNNLKIRGEEEAERISLLQYHTISDLQFALLYSFGKDAIGQAVTLLKDLNFISIHQSPYLKTDRTRYFLFFADNVNEWIATHEGKIRKFVHERKFDDAKSEIRLCTFDNSIMEKRNSDDAEPEKRNTVNTEIASKRSPPPPPTSHEEIQAFWEIPLPTQVEKNREALVAAAKKAGRSPTEMQAATRAAILVVGARDFVALAIARLKDKHWTAPPPEKTLRQEIMRDVKDPTRRMDELRRSRNKNWKR